MHSCQSLLLSTIILNDIVLNDKHLNDEDALCINTIIHAIFKPGQHAPGFLELLLSANVCMLVCVCVCVCVRPGAINN